MFTDEDFYPIFFEMYKTHSKFSHMQLECIPLPKKIGELSPIYFKVNKSFCYNIKILPYFKSTFILFEHFFRFTESFVGV